jgi:hypothetical protein
MNDSEIEKVRQDEIRGRKAGDSAHRDKLQRLKKLMLQALQKGNRDLFKQVLIDLGQKRGSSEYEASLKAFDDYQRGRR